MGRFVLSGFARHAAHFAPARIDLGQRGRWRGLAHAGTIEVFALHKDAQRATLRSAAAAAT
jgi:hypothetical protein